jgi:hypothetical protein
LPSCFTRTAAFVPPFALVYAGSHNRATIRATDEDARLETTVPDSAVGLPDDCFARLDGDVEIKTLWNITERTIDQTDDVFSVSIIGSLNLSI